MSDLQRKYGCDFVGSYYKNQPITKLPRLPHRPHRNSLKRKTIGEGKADKDTAVDLLRLFGVVAGIVNSVIILTVDDYK